MWLNSTAQHAIRAVVYLAEHGGEGPVTVTDVAAALGAPRNYLSKTMHALVQAGVLHSTRGPAGGFWLAVDPAALTLARVTEPFGDIAATRCLLGRSACSSSNPCALHTDWSRASAPAQQFFKHTTIADLLHGVRRDPRRAVTHDLRPRRRAG